MESIATHVTCCEAAYMEAAMDWYLTYRTPAALLSLADGLPGARVEVEPRGIIAYLTLRR